MGKVKNSEQDRETGGRIMKQGGRIMRLNKEGLQDRQWWLDRGYQLPEYDREAVTMRSLKTSAAHVMITALP